MNKICLLLFVLLFFNLNNPTYAQSPSNPTANTTWDSDPNTAGNQSSASTLTQIQNAYNNARRQEEIQLSLSTNALGNLVLPSDWSTYTPHKKAWFILNAERTCRAGIDYDGSGPNPPVLGLPFEMVDTTLNGIEQRHVEWLVANNLFQHLGAGNTQPSDRLENKFPDLVCSEFLPRIENLYFIATTSTTVTGLIERAIYSWLYTDAASSWGHRIICLTQNIDVNNTPNSGLTNNYGSALSEGRIGIGIAGANNAAYNPFNTSGFNRSDVVSLLVLDPVSTALAASNNCNYVDAFVANVLPIELSNFNAIQKGKDVLIQWTTASEKDNAYFTIERSANGDDFQTITKVQGKGNSTQTAIYNYIDKNVSTGIYYYRLVQHDFDGSSTTSKLLAVRYFDQLGLAVYPDYGTLNISFNSTIKDNAMYEIFNSNGIVVQSGQLNIESGMNQIQLDAAALNAGMYILSLNINTHKETTKFIVTH